MTGFDERILNGMGVLSAIVDTGSFAAAGDMLDMSQSGVSRCIARLEARLGVRLLDRTTRSVTLTDEGRRRLEAVRQIEREKQEAWDKMSDAERAQADREWEMFKKSMNEARAGGRIPYPD